MEITQRCNLDCSACYLSEHAEAVKDLPLEEVFRRIDMIRDAYGSDVDIQVTGGDPTLRKADELVAIVRRISERGMRPALFTNGIRASRALLTRLADAGLIDVAFHVDMTQERRGYGSESELNELRLAYIERARGLPLAIYFNTTVFGGNIEQIPSVVAFFAQHSDVVRLVSFQPVAKTGRGILDPRSSITTNAVIRQIERGVGTSVTFDTAHVGHSRCNRYGMTFIANGRAYDALDNKRLYTALLSRTAKLRFDRQRPRHAIATFLKCLAMNPDVAARASWWFLRKLWHMKDDLIAARGRVNKLSFFIHNFMDACELDPERIRACVFMAATRDGPVSMCLFNAHRDTSILRPVRLEKDDGEWFWNPLSGEVAKGEPVITPPEMERPRRGRTKAARGSSDVAR
jgi:uncharacterized radical SAM superfamily Fe-S cluster-containing enzyme